ncbi:unnamed protein product [Mytilus coruscus]|uniref:Uncharacterized protein n=1 Tax=Mytilus coruscus TaxID=42192 RepID=A0A6J8BH64_MYTCO|nr:unnamed protein product [Mytilus coruscus]
MASSGGALNLSLLSRGIGEISKNGHEKIDVVFEPQDYFNFVGNSSRIYLPPIPPKYDFDGIPSTTKSSHFKSSQEIPKTFTTRKGALLLYSEDQAHKVQSSHHDFKKAGHRRPHPTEETLELSKSADELELKTVDDLAKSILSFGKREPTNDDTDIYLGFIHNTYGRRKKDLFERQIRPGFSAKRYLSLWTKSWDDNVLGKVISKGYLTEKSLFYYNPLNPHLQRRLNDDMSHFPAPYKLMRSMLMSPGSLSGYTFYRVRPESAETVVTPEQLPERTPSQMGSIKVISTKDGVQKEVSYSTLDKVAQEEVLTDLLVKSAVHYAMKKQQELMEGSQREEAIQEVDENRSSVQQFDMRDAVESLLDSQKSKGVLNTDFPEDKSEASSRSGSIKGKTLKRRSKDKDSESSRATSPLPFDNAEGEKEYVGSVPVASVRGDQSSVPQLPHISGAMPLTPIGEASREGTRMTIPVSLPPIGQDQGIDGVPLLTVLPPTPQHSSLTASPTKMVKDSKLLPQDEGNEEFSDESGVGVKTERTDRHYGEETERKRRVRKIKAENTGPSVSGGYHLHSSTESLGGPGSAHSLPTAKPLRTHWKGSTQSLKSDRSKKGYEITEKKQKLSKKVEGKKTETTVIKTPKELPAKNISESNDLTECLVTLAINKSLKEVEEDDAMMKKEISTKDEVQDYKVEAKYKVQDFGRTEKLTKNNEIKGKDNNQRGKYIDSAIEGIERSRSFVEMSAEKNEFMRILPPQPNYLLDRKRQASSFRLDLIDRKRRLSVLIEEPIENSEGLKTDGYATDEKLKLLQTLNRGLFGIDDPYKEFERNSIKRTTGSDPDKKTKSVRFRLDSDEGRKLKTEGNISDSPSTLTNERLKTLKETSKSLSSVKQRNTDLSKDRLLSLSLSSFSTKEWTTLTSESLKRRDYTVRVGEDSNIKTEPLKRTENVIMSAFSKTKTENEEYECMRKGGVVKDGFMKATSEELELEDIFPEERVEFDEEIELLNFLHDTSRPKLDAEHYFNSSAEESDDLSYVNRKEDVNKHWLALTTDHKDEGDDNDEDDDDDEVIDKVAEYQKLDAKSLKEIERRIILQDRMKQRKEQERNKKEERQDENSTEDGSTDKSDNMSEGSSRDTVEKKAGILKKSSTSSRTTSSLPEDSNKGSIVIGPDGEPISVGGHIEAHTRPEQQHIENVGDANRYFGRETESKIKEEESEGQISAHETPVSEQDLISDQESDDEPDVWKRRRGVQREDMRNYAHKREIDYTGGDIDATLSINSWSYQPRDTDPEFAGIVSQMNRASSLPGMPFRSGSQD